VQACRKLGVVEITAHGLRHSAATILLNHVEKYAIVLRGSLSESASHPNQPYSGK
jgi:integrase